MNDQPTHPPSSAGPTTPSPTEASSPAGDRQPLQDLESTLRDALLSFADLREMRILTEEERALLRQLELDAEQTGAAGGLMEFVNDGIHQALAADIVFAVTTGPMTAEPPGPWTIMVDAEDQVIGEWLPASKIQPAREGGRCIFLSEDFVLYKDRRPRGKSRFVMPFIGLPLSEDQVHISVCGIGCPSTPADEYIRGLMGNPGKDIATLVLGVSLA